MAAAATLWPTTARSQALWATSALVFVSLRLLPLLPLLLLCLVALLLMVLLLVLMPRSPQVLSVFALATLLPGLAAVP